MAKRMKQPESSGRVEASFFHASITVNGQTRVLEQNRVCRELREGVWVDVDTGQVAESPFAEIGAAIAGLFLPEPAPLKQVESKEVKKR